MSVSSRYHKGKRQDRGGISATAVAVVLVIVVSIAGAVYVGYEQSLIPSAKISIKWGGTCSGLTFTVTNTGNKVLRVWSVNLETSPSGSGITWTPSTESVGKLGPQGQYSNSFVVSLAGTPPGTYKFTASLVNGSQTIATSNTLSCTLK